MRDEAAGSARAGGRHRLRYRRTRARVDIGLPLPAGVMSGLTGPDGVGKSSLLSVLSVLAGALGFRHGRVELVAGDMRHAAFRIRVSPRIACMPQGPGRKL